MNSWTIPADPGLQTRRPNTDVAREADSKPLKPRIRPEAMMNAIKNQGTIAQLFNPCLKPPTLRASSRSGKNLPAFFSNTQTYSIANFQLHDNSH